MKIERKLLQQKGYATIALKLVIEQLIAKAKETAKTVVDIIILPFATGTDPQDSTAAVLTTTEVNVVYPTVLVQVNGITCCALLDTATRSSYASTTLTERINQQPIRKGYMRIKMMLHTTTKTVDISSKFEYLVWMDVSKSIQK